jgi:hypothetical protein
MCFPVLASCCDSCTRVPIALYEKCKGLCNAQENTVRREQVVARQLRRREDSFNQYLQPFSNKIITLRMNDEPQPLCGAPRASLLWRILQKKIW